MTKVLVVEDNQNLLTLYTEELGDEGYEVRGALSGKKAIKEVEKDRPDIVVLDICLPDIDGIHVLEKILAIDKSIKIVLNTAYSTYKDNFMTWSADAYVIKSADLTELKETVRKVLETARAEP